MTQHPANRKKKVLVSGHDLKFWRPLQQSLEQTGLFDFREDEWQGHNAHDPVKTLSGIEWADIVVAEWALGNAVFCARHKKENQRLIIRLHSQERRTDYIRTINYHNVDQIVFVGEHVMTECIRDFSVPAEKCRVIGNFVDLKKFALPKFGGTEFNLGMIGIVPAMKRLDLALDTLEALLEKDERYCLHVKGQSPRQYSWLWARTKEREYYEEVFERINSGPLRYRVVFDPPGNDVQRWFQKIGFLLSPSDFESFHMAVAEGMCCGTVPIVWNWGGADVLYPFIERIDSPCKAADQIDILRSSASRANLSAQCVEFVRENYDADIVRTHWQEMFYSPLKELSRRREDSVSLKNKKGLLIVYAIDPWETFHRTEMLRELARHIEDEYDILVIEPGTHYQHILNLGRSDKASLDLYSALTPIQVENNVFKICILLHGFPADIEPHPRLKGKQGAVGYRDAIQVAAREIFGKDREIVHWLYKPNQRTNVVDGQTYIYEVYDEYTMDFVTGELIQEIVDMEPDVLANASHVFFTSEPLAKRKAHDCASWSILGNGVCFDAFNRFNVKNNKRNELRRCAGYLGNLSNFFDWRLMVQVVEALPEIDFFFHGQVERHRLLDIKDLVDKLIAAPNTYFSGRVTRPIGASAVNRYDVLLIPFVVNDAMHAVNPLKLWEYFATGRPVVMTPMDAIRKKIPGLYIANGKDEWIESIVRAVGKPDGKDEARIRAAQEVAWETLTHQCGVILRKVLEADSRGTRK